MLLVSLPARAWDVNISSTTSTQVYDVYTGTPGEFLHRRRITERLTLRLDRILPDEDDAGYDGPRMSFALTLRLDTDFGHVDAETNPSSDLWFVPGFDPYALDLMVVELSVRELFRGTTDIRAGRLVTLDPTGFAALDGIEVRVRIQRWVELWAATGVEVVSGQRLSSGNFEVDGVIRARRDDFDEEQSPEVRDPPTRVVIGAGASLIGLDWLGIDLAYRQGVIPGDEAVTSYQRLAGLVAFEAGPVHGNAIAGGDLALGLVDQIGAEVAVRPLSWLRLGLGGRYDAPVFDTDSIFAVFWAEPSIEGELLAELLLLRGLRLGLSGYVRDVSFLQPEGDDPETLGYGGAVFGRVAWRWLRGEIKARLGHGYGGLRLGVMWRFAALIPRYGLGFDFRGTLLGLREDVAPYERRVSVGYVIGGRYQMSEEAAILLEFEHNASHDRGHQLRFLALLDLGFWL